MGEKKKRIFSSFKLILAFTLGFWLWHYAVLGLNLIGLNYGVNPLWAVVLSRFALLGYLLPFVLWFFVAPHSVYPLRFGDTAASIKIPCIWYGIKDNVKRVCVVFSALCFLLAGIFFYTKQVPLSVLTAGAAFALVNSLLEEFLWRGFILSRIIDLYGEKIGLILMSLAFGLYHLPLGFSIPVCLLFSLGGIYFGGIAIRSKGLLLGTLMHISMNIFFVSIGIIF